MTKPTIKRRAIRRRFTVPIFGEATVWVVVADDLYAEHERIGVFDPWGDDERYQAVVSYDGRGNFGLFMEPSHTDDNTLAHELFHLTHRIAEWCGVPFHPENHEPFACLQGWLAEKVYSIVRRK